MKENFSQTRALPISSVSGVDKLLNHALSFDLWKCLKEKRMDEIGFLKKKNIEFESELNEARRDIDSYRQQIENMNKSELGLGWGWVGFGPNFELFLDLKKERENFQETKEGEERHFQRNIVRLNEEIERERMFR